MTEKTKKDELAKKALDCLADYLSDLDDLQQFREYADRAYMGQPIDVDGQELEEIDGRSAVKMSDVADTIEWIMPTLMRIFTGGQKYVELRPMGRDDEIKAKLLEEKVNFDFQRQNNGFVILHDWFKDAMLSKVAVVKYWWQEDVEREEIEFVGLTADELFALQASGKVEIKKITEQEVTVGNEFGMMQAKSFDVKGYKVTKTAKPCAEPLPPEEFVFDVGAREITKESFCAHRKRVHKNYLMSKYNLTEEDLKGQAEKWDSDRSNLLETRFEDLTTKSFITDTEDGEYYFIYECYLADYDDEGTPIPMKVVMFGDEAVEVTKNTYGKPPFCLLSAIRRPYRAVGLSLAELVMEIQKLRTALVRACLDNIYYQNNGVKVVNPYRIDLDDVIDHNHPGAVWRTQYDIDPRTAIFPVPVTPLSQQTFTMLEWVETIKENRTGVTKYNQGLDSKSLNKTATGISQIMSAAQQRMELIARLFAETGVKELFQAFVDMNIKFFDQETSVRINDEWINLTPDMIDGKFDVVVDVGVGTGTNELKVGQMTQLMNLSLPLAQVGVVTPENIYNQMATIYELQGYKNVEKYITKPQPQGIPPEIVNAALGILAQGGLNVDGLLQEAAAQVQQSGANRQGAPGQSPAQPPLNG